MREPGAPDPPCGQAVEWPTGGGRTSVGRTHTDHDPAEHIVSLSTEEVQHIARLARLGLDDEEMERLRPQLSDIIAYAEKVGEVAAEDVPPTGHAFPLRNVLREDVPRESLPPQEALSTAPQAEDGRFHVPRIVGEEA